MTRAHVAVAILNSLWLSFGNSLYARVIKNTYGQPEILGGITITKDGLVLTAGPTAGMWTGGSNDSGNMQMDCGESGHYFGDWKITN